MSENQPNPLDLLPTVDSLLEHMEGKSFWDTFFSGFLLTVHPAEFAVRVPGKGEGQKEEALSAAFHRTLLQFRTALELDQWVPVLEAPVFRQGKALAFCDITLTPWVSHSRASVDASWAGARLAGRHVRIEVKWIDGKPKLPAITYKAASNESRQHFVVTLVFHGEGYVPPQNGDEVPFGWQLLYSEARERLGAEFSKDYSKFSLVVLKSI